MKSSLRFWEFEAAVRIFNQRLSLLIRKSAAFHWRSADQSEQIYFPRRKSYGVTKIGNKIVAVSAGVKFPVDFESVAVSHADRLRRLRRQLFRKSANACGVQTEGKDIDEISIAIR
jgi:hypothetical protein